MSIPASRLHTLGHSNHPIEKFIGLLQANGVIRLVDVRSVPFSRFHPQFIKSRLEAALAEHGIEYVYAGNDLGGRPSDPSCYKDGKLPSKGSRQPSAVDFSAVMQRPWFVDGMNRLMELANEAPTAILCSEESPAKCHRHHLIARYLRDHYPEWEVSHIRGDGRVEDAEQTGWNPQL